MPLLCRVTYIKQDLLLQIKRVVEDSFAAIAAAATDNDNDDDEYIDEDDKHMKRKHIQTSMRGIMCSSYHQQAQTQTRSLRCLPFCQRHDRQQTQKLRHNNYVRVQPGESPSARFLHVTTAKFYRQYDQTTRIMAAVHVFPQFQSAIMSSAF